MGILDYIRTLLSYIKTLKTTVSNHPKKFLLLACVLVGGYIYYLRKSRITIEVQLADFINALVQNQLSQVSLGPNNRIKFRPSHNKGIVGKTSAKGIQRQQVIDFMALYPRVAFKYTTAPKKQYLQYILAVTANVVAPFLFASGVTILLHTLFKQSTYHFGQRKLSLEKDRKTNNSNQNSITFRDIYGLRKAKEALSQSIDFMKNPERYIKMGCRLRRGIIFYGPPGTGKTLLAKATAGETESEFIFCSASEFVEMYVGVGAKRVRQLFAKARSYKSAILFIDEIDALGNRMSKSQGDAERNATLNQFLTEMDGFESGGRVLVIAATNRLNMIDEALLRPGRFDLKIQVNSPQGQDRAGILGVHLNKKQAKISPQTIRKIAQQADGFSGADLEHITNESAYEALKDNSDYITDKHLLKCFEEQRISKAHQLGFNRAI